MVEFINKRYTPQIASRTSARGLTEKKNLKTIENNLFVNQYNNFVDLFETNIFENESSDIKISTFESFTYDYVKKLAENVNTNLEKVITDCNENIYNNITSTLEELFIRLHIVELPQIQEATNKFQTGGTTEQENNKNFILNDIQKLLLNLTSKCARYCSNTFNTCLTANTLKDCMKYVSDNYKTDDFCYQLLFDQEDDYTLESENLGFVIGLKIIADQYTYSDLLEYSSTPDERLPPPDKILTVNDMLFILEIPQVNIILYLLTWSSDQNVQLLFDLIEFPCNNTLKKCLENFMGNKLGEYNKIKSFLFENFEDQMSIFSIIGLGFFNFAYYGNNSQCFYPALCHHFLNVVEKGLIYLNYPPNRILQKELMLLNTMYSYIAAKELGQIPSETGPSEAAGVRSTKQPTKYGYENDKRETKRPKMSGGFKKFKTIKHKKNKNIKMTRNYKKIYNKSIKVIKTNKKHKTRRQT